MTTTLAEVQVQVQESLVQAQWAFSGERLP
jgi:hypothetical protein